MKKQWLLTAAMLAAFTWVAACGNGTGGGGTVSEGSSGGTQAKQGKAGSELLVYTALEDDQIKQYLQTWDEQHPDIKINIIRDSTGIITARLLAEKDNPQADVVWGTAATSLLVLDQNDMLEPYSPTGIERIQTTFKDDREPAHWVGIDAWETAFAVNKTEMEKKGLAIPRSYEDLLKPEYKGLITMPNPASSGTGFLTVSGLIQLMGADKAWAYMDKLNENIAMYVHSGSKPAKMAGTGEYPIGISFGYRVISEQDKGTPVEAVFPAEGSGWDVEANALIKKPNINPAAKEFLDWAITDDAMKEYKKNYPITAVKDESGELPAGYAKNPVDQLIKYDLQAAAKDRDEILREWTRRYDGKSEPKS